MRIPLKYGIFFVILIGIGFTFIIFYNTTHQLKESEQDIIQRKKLDAILKSVSFRWGPSYDTDKVTSSSSSASTTTGNDEIPPPIGDTTTPSTTTTTPTTVNLKCKNTVQGIDYVTDSQGYLCSRQYIDLVTGCCNQTILQQHSESFNSGSKEDNNNDKQQQPTTTATINKKRETTDSIYLNYQDPKEKIFERFTCRQCKESMGCCKEYEFCVSCCMRNDKISTLRDTFFSILEKNYSSFIKSQFDLCSVACRTSSNSLSNQREYKQQEYKFCYGPTTPPQQQQQQT